MSTRRLKGYVLQYVTQYDNDGTVTGRKLRIVLWPIFKHAEYVGYDYKGR